MVSSTTEAKTNFAFCTGGADLPTSDWAIERDLNELKIKYTWGNFLIKILFNDNTIM